MGGMGIGEFMGPETVRIVSARMRLTGTMIEPRAVDSDGVKPRGAG